MCGATTAIGGTFSVPGRLGMLSGRAIGAGGCLVWGGAIGGASSDGIGQIGVPIGEQTSLELGTCDGGPIGPTRPGGALTGSSC